MVNCTYTYIVPMGLIIGRSVKSLLINQIHVWLQIN